MHHIWTSLSPFLLYRVFNLICIECVMCVCLFFCFSARSPLDNINWHVLHPIDHNLWMRINGICRQIYVAIAAYRVQFNEQENPILVSGCVSSFNVKTSIYYPLNKFIALCVSNCVMFMYGLPKFQKLTMKMIWNHPPINRKLISHYFAAVAWAQIDQNPWE